MDAPISAKAALLRELQIGGSGTGAELIRRIRERTDGLLALREGSVYPALVDLANGDLVRRTGIHQQRYAITEQGKLLSGRHAAIIGQLYGVADVPKQARTLPAKLTPRQTNVVAMLLTGRSNKEIADELGISYGTLRKHVERIYRAVGIHSRAELIARSNR